LCDQGDHDRALRTLQRIKVPEPFLKAELSALKGRAWAARGFPDLAIEELMRVPAAELARAQQGAALALLSELLEAAGRPHEALRAALSAQGLDGGGDQTERVARLMLRTRTMVESAGPAKVPPAEAKPAPADDWTGRTIAGD